jgi:hypothetical protein
MKMKKSMIMVLAVTALCGCLPEQTSDATDNIYSDVPVELTGVISMGEETRGEGVIENGISSNYPTKDLVVSIFRADEDASTDAYSGVYQKAVYGTFKSDGTFVMSPEQTYYANSNRSSKFIALYPMATREMYNESEATVTYQIDGSTDIMTGNFVEGSKGAPIDTPMEFRHLLTQLKVKIEVDHEADLEVIRAGYGKIKGISIAGRRGQAVAYLPLPNRGDTVATIAFSDGAALSVVTPYTAGVDIPENTMYYGYAMFVPTEETLELTVVTERNDPGVTTVTLTAGTVYAAGESREVTLKFSKSSIKAITDNFTAILNAWSTTDLGTVTVP